MDELELSAKDVVRFGLAVLDAMDLFYDMLDGLIIISLLNCQRLFFLFKLVVMARKHDRFRSNAAAAAATGAPGNFVIICWSFVHFVKFLHLSLVTNIKV